MCAYLALSILVHETVYLCLCILQRFFTFDKAYVTVEVAAVERSMNTYLEAVQNAEQSPYGINNQDEVVRQSLYLVGFSFS